MSIEPRATVGDTDPPGGWDPEPPDAEPMERAELAAAAAAPGPVDVGALSPPGPSAEERAARRASDLRLARLHLRLGAYILARAELESANEDRSLSDGSLLDLAEVRWRTGDLAAAGRAAEASLAEGEETLLATVIAAEAALADGRPSDASDLAGKALDLAGDGDDALAAVFAGAPRSTLWPADPSEAALTGDTSAGRPPARSGRSGGLANMPRTRLETPRPAHGSTSSARPRAAGERPEADPLAELAAAEADLESGDTTSAAIRLGVVLRLAPALAPAVLELLEDVNGPLAALIRGDAYRLVGREAEAEQAYAEATQAVAADVGDAPASSPRQETLEDAQ